MAARHPDVAPGGEGLDAPARARWRSDRQSVALHGELAADHRRSSPGPDSQPSGAAGAGVQYARDDAEPHPTRAHATKAMARAMRVLLLSLFHPELVRGGAQQICYELFNGLREREGIEPSLLAAIDQSFPSLYKVGAHITGFDGRDGEFLFLSREYDYRWHKTGDPSLAHAYAEFLRRMQPDVVHVHHFLLFGIDILTLTRKVLPSAR